MTVDEARKALGEVYDPELGYSVTELGMIYRVEVSGDEVSVDYGLTAIGCPLADAIEEDIRRVLRAADPVASVRTRLVLDPPWSPERMSEALRLEFGYSV